MNRWRFIGPAGAILLICIFWPVAGPAGAAGIPEALNQAFRHSNASALEAYFAADGRVQLSLGAAGIASGNYSAKQAVALLDQAFRNVDIVSFDLTAVKGTGIRGEWVVRGKGGGSQRKIILYVSVGSRDGRPVITSIQGSG